MKLTYRLLMLAVFLSLMLAPPTKAFAATYTVEPGDSLFSISVNHGTTIHRLMEANQLKSTRIWPGQQLIIPDKEDVLPSNTRGYLVVPGDNLYQIALSLDTTTQTLVAANHLAGAAIHPSRVLLTPSREAEERCIPCTDEELDLLARLICAEAGSEPNTNKVAVAAVVINRVQSPLFPNSIRDVIYQPRQFGPAQTGKINRPAPECCYIAAQEALKGKDPTNGALFFFDKGSNNSYLGSLPVAFTHGNLIFCYPR
ncbi:LysM peptidoglycan-binding domain-containing protein [Desulfofalx alkaliphila]|uniref:LysM peptidoglycan-binding domain-containing protein n=1 Tax=Desulfofalx alkaliphila TaxID=105483 RepID=UPI0004E1A3F6|nr:LysM peptidoglycan-binding domain-containing protein [Desulfofalx alkaliphila]